MTSAVILGMIVTMFPEPRERAQAIGVYSFVASAGASIGLLAGGVLTEAISWHWIFFVNVPIGLVAAGLAARLIERDHGRGLGHGADAAGAVLVTSALMLGVFAIVGAADHGWGSARTLGVGAWPWPSWPASSCASRARPTRSCRSACSARATSPAPTSSRSSWSPGCSGCSSWARCTSSASSGSTPSRSASPSCRCPC